MKNFFRLIIDDFGRQRISPDELRDKFETGADVAIVDLRLPLDFAAAPQTLPGAIRLAPEEVASRHQEIPRDREIVLYCSCPDEYTSARVAFLLKQYGIHRVRPLAGGYETWRERNFPLTPAAVLPLASASRHLDVTTAT